LEQVITTLRQEAGAHFDPRLTQLLLDNLDQFLHIRHTYGDEGDDESGPAV